MQALVLEYIARIMEEGHGRLGWFMDIAKNSWTI